MNTIANPWTILRLIPLRRRFSFAMNACYLLAMLITANFALAGAELSIGGQKLPEVGWYLGLPSMLSFLFWIGAVCQVDAEDDSEEGFTDRIYILPLTTVEIVLPLMIIGGSISCFLWWIIRKGVFEAGGVDVGAAPIGASLWLTTNVAQLLTWTRFSNNWLRIAAALAIVCLFGAAAAGFYCFEVGTSATLTVIAASIVAINALTVCLVSRSRCGERISLPRLTFRLNTRRSTAKSSAPHGNASAALFWLEWRTFGWLFPAFVGTTAFCLCVFAVVARGDQEATIGQVVVPCIVAPLFAFTLGSMLGKFKAPGSKDVYEQFLFTLPLSDADIYNAKIRLVATSATVGLVILSVIFAVFCLEPKSLAAIRHDLAGASGYSNAWLYSLSFCGLIAVTQKELLTSLWIGLTGRSWMENAIASVVGALFLALVLLTLFPFTEPIKIWLFNHLGELLFGAFVLKTIIAAALLGFAMRSRLVTARWALGVVGIWGFAAIVLFMAIKSGAGPEFAWNNEAFWGAAIYAPLLRIAAIPRALDWNRRR